MLKVPKYEEYERRKREGGRGKMDYNSEQDLVRTTILV